MAWIGIPLGILAFAFVVNGFPDINIGNTTKNYYYNEEEEDKEEE